MPALEFPLVLLAGAAAVCHAAQTRGDGRRGTISMLSEIVADPGLTVDAELQARWRRYPNAQVAMATSRISADHTGTRAQISNQTGRSRGEFPYVMLGGFLAFVVLHAFVNHVRDIVKNGGEPPEQVESIEPPSGEPEASPHSMSRERLEAAGWLVCWMVFSTTFVIYNKWLFTRGGFPHPIWLTTFHMLTCFVVFWLVRVAAPTSVRAQMMPDADKVVAWDVYFKGLLPISLLYGYCLGAGNLAFMYSSVAFLQIIKPINILFTSLAAFAFQLEIATLTHVIIVCVILGGVSLAASGDAEFSPVGCLLQLSASLAEAIRLVLLQKVMTKDKLDPVTTVYRFAPVAGLALCVVACFLEKPVDWGQVRSPSLLVLNSVLALALNILIVTVIKKASAVVFTLGGILKDIGAICGSVAMFKTPIAPPEIIGYSVSVLGILLFKCYKDHINKFRELGFLGGFAHVVTSASSRPTLKTQAAEKKV